MLQRHLPALRQHCSPGDLARLPWIEGATLRVLGCPAEAAACYDKARRTFLELQHIDSMALVILEMEGIDREARVTLELFRQAVAAEQITLLQLRGWLGRLGVKG